MKIAIVDQPFGNIVLPWPGPRNSVNIVTYEMARRLARSCDVTVYTRRDQYQKKVEFDQGVRYRRISTVFDDWHQYFEYVIDWLGRMSSTSGISQNIRRVFLFRNVKRPFFTSNLYYLTYALQVAKDLKKMKCDIVHIHTYSQFVPIIRAFNPEIKIVLQMHCEHLTQLDPTMIESRLKEVDMIVGVSEYITEKIRRRFPQFAKRCQTSHNGANVTTFVNNNCQSTPDKKDMKQLLFVGRVSPEKGVHVLLEAFKKVLKQYPQVQLKIIGGQSLLPIELLVTLSEDSKEKDLRRFYDGNYLSNLRNQLSSSVAAHVSFTGHIPYPQVINLYKDADVCVVPSVVNEPGAMPLLEAMAAGVPVVASRGGGIPEILVDGENGLLVERGDASALAEAILRLLSDEKLRKSMGKTARKLVVELFSWDQTVKNLLHLYQKISEGNKKSS